MKNYKKNKLKILCITNMFPSKRFPYYGSFVVRIMNGLGKYFQIKIVKLQKQKNKLYKYLFYFIWLLKSLLSSIFLNYDLLYIHFVSRSSFPSIFSAKLRNKKIVINYHGSDGYDHSVWKIITKTANKFSDLIIFPSLSYSEAIKKRYSKIDEKRIYISPSGGVDNCRFNSKGINKDLSNELVVIGFVSNLTREKGVFILLESLSNLKEYNWNLEIVGTGPELESIIQIVNVMKIDDRISIKGPIEHKYLHILMKKYDLFIFPTLRTKKESLGLVGIEALSCGVPVIGSDIPALREYIHHEENGFLFERGNTKQLTDRIIQYLKMDYHAKKEMSRKAEKSVEKYTEQRIIRELAEKIYSLDVNKYKEEKRC